MPSFLYSYAVCEHDSLGYYSQANTQGGINDFHQVISLSHKNIVSEWQTFSLEQRRRLRQGYNLGRGGSVCLGSGEAGCRPVTFRDGGRRGEAWPCIPAAATPFYRATTGIVTIRCKETPASAARGVTPSCFLHEYPGSNAGSMLRQSPWRWHSIEPALLSRPSRLPPGDAPLRQPIVAQRIISGSDSITGRRPDDWILLQCTHPLNATEHQFGHKKCSWSNYWLL